MNRKLEIDQKIIPIDQVQELSSNLRNNEKTIVFTNGCFDILHVGHVQYLQAAASLGDILVIGLNSDNSVARLKGEKRPIVPQDERAYLLSSLSIVDYVVIFDEDTPFRLISAVLPNILVKGGDYIAEEIVGYDIVTNNGGRVEIIPFVKGKSTTNIIKKILEST